MCAAGAKSSFSTFHQQSADFVGHLFDNVGLNVEKLLCRRIVSFTPERSLRNNINQFDNHSNMRRGRWYLWLPLYRSIKDKLNPKLPTYLFQLRSRIRELLCCQLRHNTDPIK